MDSNPLERERGITILAKNTSVHWHGTKINIVDTPGHADFGGEVERILRMVDGVLLVVDAFDGPMPQTRFVLRKALALGRTPIVVINKIDRPGADPHRVHDEVLDLFIELEADDGAARRARRLRVGAARASSTMDLDAAGAGSRAALRRRSSRTCPQPPHDAEWPFQMLISTIDHSPYLGRLGIGRIERGTVHVGDEVALLPLDPRSRRPSSRASPSSSRFEGLERIEVPERESGEIVALAGLEDVEIGLTVTDRRAPGAARGHRGRGADDLRRLPRQQLALRRQGREVRDVAAAARAALPRARAQRRAARRGHRRHRHVDASAGAASCISPSSWRRCGARGTSSRCRARASSRAMGPSGERLEPYEELSIDVPEEFLGVVIEKLGPRRGEMLEMKNPGQNLVRILYRIPARGLVRLSLGIPDRYAGNRDHPPPLPGVRSVGGAARGAQARHRSCPWKGAPIVAFGLWNLQDRSTLFVRSGDAGVRRDDHRREFAAGRHGRESDEGEEAVEHADQRHRREHPAGAAAGVDAGRGAGVYRGRRADRDHPRDRSACGSGR